MQMSLFDGSNKFIIDKPIRLIEAFAGYGSQHFALQYLGANFESWRICEWAVKSIQAYKDAHFKDDITDYSKDLTKEEVFEFLSNKGISANYNEPMTFDQIKRMGEENARVVYNNIMATHNLVNIQQVHGKDLEIVETDKYCYMLTYSFPCFTADSLVLTSDGYKRICNIEDGDLVLSHDNKYHKVVNVFYNGTHDIYKINAMGVDEIKTTYNHRFYVREKYKKGHKQVRCFKEPIWKEVKDLTKNDYLGIAINQNNTSIVSNKLPTQNDNFWWLIGRYLGDGWIRQQGGIIICCAKNELNEITHKLDKLQFNYNIVEEKSIYKVHIPKKALSDFVEQFGQGAIGKHLTKQIFDLPIFYLRHLIDGYISADGCFTNGVYKATSISRELIYGIAQCVAKVYKTPYRIYKVEPPKNKIIEDRLVYQHNWYQLVYKLEKKKQDKAFYEDGYIWYPINSIKYIGKDSVYDIEVEDSHSFTVQNTIVHNCQDLSLAGLRKGMGKESGTRSGMLWEIERILDELNNGDGELPQVLVMENVPEVIGINNIKHFAKWVEKLEELGYKNKWEILNGKDFGIPQNRERCFMVSVLGDYYYDFPEKTKLKLKLKDMLETNVDEKFYLSDTKIQSISRWKAQQDPLKDIDKEKIICPTLTARGAGEEHSGMVLINENAYKDEENLKTKLCNELIKSGKVEEGDVIRHSYSNSRMNNFYASNKENRDCSPTLDTRCDCLGVVVKNNYLGTFDYNKSETFMKGRDRLSVGTEIANTVLTSHSDGIAFADLRIRKMTPRESFRLMGVKDEDFERIAEHQSNASLYHLAGDSIIVDILCAIFKQML